MTGIPVAVAESGRPAISAAHRRMLVSCFLGTTIEWYDFLVYGFLAPARVQRPVLPVAQPAGRHDRGVRRVCGRIRGPAARRRVLRALRRPRRAQADHGVHADPHGRLDDADGARRPPSRRSASPRRSSSSRCGSCRASRSAASPRRGRCWRWRARPATRAACSRRWSRAAPPRARCSARSPCSPSARCRARSCCPGAGVLPFIASAPIFAISFYVRMKVEESPIFQRAVRARRTRARAAARRAASAARSRRSRCCCARWPSRRRSTSRRSSACRTAFRR